LGEGTKAQVLAALSAVFSYACDAGYIARNPCRELSKTQRPRQGAGRQRILSPDEQARLLAYSETFSWLRPVIVVATNQALRLGEVVGLDWEDVDFANNKLRVHQQFTRVGQIGPTKTAKPSRPDRRDTHPIDLMPAAREALLQLVEEAEGDSASGPVFRNSLGGRRGHRDVSHAFEKAVRFAALPETQDGRVSFHTLRHTGISRLANSPRVALVYVRDFAGHTSLSITEGYVHRIESAEATAAAAEALAHSWHTGEGATGNGSE
jgi:integrase